MDAKSGNAPQSQNWVKGQLSVNFCIYEGCPTKSRTFDIK